MTAPTNPAGEPQPDDWQQGWWRHARRLASPNFGPRPQTAVVDLVVIHSISLPPGQYGGPEIEQLFTNRLDWDAHPYFAQIRGIEVSSHFVIRRDGGVTQFVSCDDRAWHAGRSTFQGRENCNDYSIGVELEGLEDEPFTGPQYAALVPLLIALRGRYPIEHVAGHEHIAPGRKRDPGSAFDWSALVLALGWSARCFPFLPPHVSDGVIEPGDAPRRG